jgi:hypothetical protein
MTRYVRAAATVGGALANPLTARAMLAPARRLAAVEHGKAAVDWLLEANRQVPERQGFSIGYFLDQAAWQPAYVETTGYIIPTLIRWTGRSEYRARDVQEAIGRSAEWLLNVQFRDGSYGNPTHYTPTVFDTGQVIFGLRAAFRHLADERYVDAAIRAADWLCSVQEEDGAWRRGAYGSVAHTYYAEVAWALALMWRLTGEPRYRAAAARHLEWVLARQLPNGYFELAGFQPDAPAVLHTIAYAVQGVYEAGRVLKEEPARAAAHRAAAALCARQRGGTMLAGELDRSWRPAAGYRCLTGLAQIAVVWLRMADERPGGSCFGEEAARVRAYLCGRQLLAVDAAELRGGLLGSAPAWGRYFRFRLPNWGVKFFLDLLLQDRSWAVRTAGCASASGRGVEATP